MKKITLLALFCCGGAFAQIVNTAPYILTVDELKVWTATGPTASTDLISTVALAPRFTNAETQFDPALNNDMQIAYLPDGMNNFGNYYGEQDQFNLYNFTHWAYIDKLVWFGGTASQTVQLPSSPWANAAHKNGVKIFGNIFFSPTAFGGSTATLQNFLEQDGTGNFVAVPKLIAIMQYYHFDGWFINQETATTGTVAALMHDFVRDLTAQAEAVGKEVMWYDAMRLSGAVGWQNRLNVNNSPFVQDDADGNGTFETRVGSSIFINFFWASNAFPTMSRARAQTIGRSQYEVFTGMDIWPGRNQGDFELTGNQFMGYLHEDAATPFTSLGLFAPNCVYNNSTYTNFNNDPNDYLSFYNAENKMFAGDDNNPATVDATGWKGFCNWIPETSVIDSQEFTTSFNTGHGLKKFISGNVVAETPWHDMNQQEVLPTWQWAFTPGSGLTASWDFDDAYNGGNSLKISGSLAANTNVDLMLFKTKIPLSLNGNVVSEILLNYKETVGLPVMIKLLLVFSDEPTQRYELPLTNESGNVWVSAFANPVPFLDRELAMIGLRFSSGTEDTQYSVNIGQLQFFSTALSTHQSTSESGFVTVTYPKNKEIIFNVNWPNASRIDYTVFNLQGKAVRSSSIELHETTSHPFDSSGLPAGTYIVKFRDDRQSVATKYIRVR